MSVYDEGQAKAREYVDAVVAGLKAEVLERDAMLRQMTELVESLQTERDTARQELADHLATHEPEPTSRPMIFGAATSNRQDDFDALDALWGPIRASREYDSNRGILPVTQYAWHAFVKRNFRYLAFSVDQGDYAATARGDHDDRIRAMVESLSTLPGVQGVVLLGNEVNAPDKGIDPEAYRAALERCIDVHPLPAGWRWGIAFTNFVSWGQGRTEGERWLPRRPDHPFVVETHVYGKTTYVDPEDSLGRSFLPAVRKRPAWGWSLGEMSAQESDQKGPWFRKMADYAIANGCEMFLPFDTGVGGSAPIGTSDRTIAYVKAIAEECAGNDWR